MGACACANGRMSMREGACALTREGACAFANGRVRGSEHVSTQTFFNPGHACTHVRVCIRAVAHVYDAAHGCRHKDMHCPLEMESGV